ADARRAAGVAAPLAPWHRPPGLCCESHRPGGLCWGRRESTEAAMVDAEKTSILVVDDVPEKLLVYQAVLEELGQNLVPVSSGQGALRQVRRTDFAVIRLDAQMPDMDGFETARYIRQRRRSAHTPIIFLTAYSDEVRLAEGYASGAVDYILTPVVPE